MNKMIKFVLIFVLINLIAFIAGFFGSIVLLTAKKINIPFFSSFDIEKIIPQKNVIIEKTEQVYVNNDNRLQDVYKNTKDSMIYVAEKKSNDIYSKKDIINLGFVFTSDGWIFTNNQSIFDKNKDYVVVLNDGKYYDVNKIIFDKYDFVLLKIDNQKMLVSAFGSYNDINIGSLVFSNDGYNGISVDYIGNKKNGIIELLNNNINNICLFDLSGKIIGVYGAVYEDGPKNKYGKSESIKNNLIYSVEYLKNIIYSINIKSDYIVRPDLSNFVFSEFGDIIGSNEKIEKGIYITSIGNKKNYGFKIGDLITTVNGYQINENLDFVLQNYNIGDKIKFVLIRDGQEVINNIILE